MTTNILAVIVTAYCPCAEICCGPNAKGIAANGRAPIEGISIAASRSIPLGTIVKLTVPGAFTNWNFRVDDRLARRYDKRVDVFINNHQRAKEFGKNKGTLTIITK